MTSKKCNSNKPHCDEQKTQKHKKCCPKLELSSVLSRVTSGYSAPNSISKDGSLVYCVYDINVEPGITLEAELFCNVNGTLVSKKQLQGDDSLWMMGNTGSTGPTGPTGPCPPADLPYVIVDGGQASHCFNKFSILDDDNNSVARLRILDRDFNVTATKLFADYFAPGYSFNGGSFSEDESMVAVTYVYDPNCTQSYQKSVLRVLETSSLMEVASYQYNGNTHNLTRFFTLKCKTSKGCYVTKQYLVLFSLGGTYDAENPTPVAPSLLKILCLHNGVISLVEEVELPEDCTYDIKKDCNSLYIVVGTSRANIVNEMIVQENPSLSFLATDGDEYRAYKFDCCHGLQLICTKNFNTTLDVKFYPTCDYVLINQSVSNYCPGMFELVEVDEYKCPVKCHSNTSRIGIRKFWVNFSCDGKWAIVTGSKEGLIPAGVRGFNDDSCELFNVQLYRIY